MKILFFSLISGFFYYFYLVNYFSIKPYVVSKIDIVLAENYKEFFDEKQYLSKIEDIYKIKEYEIDYELSSKILNNINDFFDFQIEMKKNFLNNKFSSFFKQNKQKIEYLGINVEDFKILKNVDIYEIEFLKRLIIEKLEFYYKQGIDETSLSHVLSEINKYIDEYIKYVRNKEILRTYKDLIIYYLSKYVVPNKFINIQKTLEKHKQLIDRIPKAYNLSKGNIIVRKGQLIDQELYEIIRITGTQKSYQLKFLFIGLLISIIIFFTSLFVFNIYRNENEKILYYIMLLGIIFSLAFISIDKPFYYLVPFWTVFIFSFFAGGIELAFLSFFLLVVLLSLTHFKLYSTLINVDLLLLIFFSFLFLLYFMLMYQKEKVWVLLNKLDFIFLIWIIIFVIAFLFLTSILGLIDNFVIYFSFLIVSIIFSLIISYLLILFLGIGLEGISLGKMRWLLDLNNPLLSELSKLAPGTFNHSLRVSELAESCAKAINANSILVKIGALYHDIGKMIRPKYFIENLIQGEVNPHDDKEPYLSATIIKSHVKDGLELAEKYKLPSIIKEFIKTHHGTTLISYFFVKAKGMKEKKYLVLREEDFRYSGPKPYTKEMLILMICDSVEAASRSLDNFSFSAIEKLTENIIERLLQDNQFSNVDITFKDLQIIKDVLIKNLYISYHTRIKYPSIKQVNEK